MSMQTYRVHKEKTWADNWNDVIRYEIFQDVELRELMCLPLDCSIAQFRDKYFIRGRSSTTEVLKDEKVRIVWSDVEGNPTRVKGVNQKFKSFDIYVKDDVLYNATNDRLKSRHDLICEKLKDIMIGERYTHNLRFSYVDDFDLFTRVPGYTLHHIDFSYKTTT